MKNLFIKGSNFAENPHLYNLGEEGGKRVNTAYIVHYTTFSPQYALPMPNLQHILCSKHQVLLSRVWQELFVHSQSPLWFKPSTMSAQKVSESFIELLSSPSHRPLAAIM